MIQCLEGLRHIHESGMAHSDIKPGNLLYSVSKEIIHPNSFFNKPRNIRDHTCFKFGDPGAVCTTSEQKGKRHFLRKNNLRYAEAKSCGISEREGKYTPGLTRVAPCKFSGTPDYIAPEFYKKHEPNIEFYQKNDVWGLGQTFRAVLHGEDKIVFVHGEDYWHGRYSKITSQLDIVPRTFEGTHPRVDNAINHVINDGMLRYNYKERANASEMLLVLNNAIETSLFEEERIREQERIRIREQERIRIRKQERIRIQKSKRMSEGRASRGETHSSQQRKLPEEGRAPRGEFSQIRVPSRRRRIPKPIPQRPLPPPEVRIRAPRQRHQRRRIPKPIPQRPLPPPEVRIRAPRQRHQRRKISTLFSEGGKIIIVNLPYGGWMQFDYGRATTIGALKAEVASQLLLSVEFLHLFYRTRELFDGETLDHSQLDLIIRRF